MSYQDLPYTYGVKTLKEINDMTGMVEGDTVFNSDWGLIEIYSGTNWTNSQSVEMIYIQTDTSSNTRGRLSHCPPIPSYGDIYQRVRCPEISGTNNDDQNGYYVMQCNDDSSDYFASFDGYIQNAYAIDDQDRGIGLTIRGNNSSTEGTTRMVIAFMGNWNGFVAPNTNSSGTSLVVTQGFFCKLSTNFEQAGMLDDSISSAINTGNAGPVLQGSTLPAWQYLELTPPDRNIPIQIQHTESA